MTTRSCLGMLLLAGAATMGLSTAAPVAAAAVSAVDCRSLVPGTSIDVDRATIPELRAALDARRVTSHQLVATYLARIAAWDSAGPRLNSVRMLNPRALAEADAMDARLHDHTPKPPLFGIPVLLKDNIDTNDMPTTAGAVALRDNRPARDATLTARLRAAGAIVLGKANLTEFANYVSTTMPNGYSGLGGQVHNPYDGGDPSGSSAGPGVASAAAFAAATVGSETDGSILSPSDADSDVGIKPTLGLVSRTGVIPISHRQDTAGPITRDVTDAAVMLDALAGSDPTDPATAPANAHRPAHGYTASLLPGGLRGARIGVPAAFDQLISSEQVGLYRRAIADLRAAGATVVNVDMPNAAQFYQPTTVLRYDFRNDLDAYLASLGPSAPMHSLAQIIAFNKAHPRAIPYGQDLMTQSEAYGSKPGTGAVTDADRLRARTVARAEIDGALRAGHLDSIIFPSSLSADLGANAGYPTVEVQAGYDSTHHPFGVGFLGTAWSEPTLIRLAYGYEQRSHRRVAPAVLDGAAYPCPVGSHGGAALLTSGRSTALTLSGSPAPLPATGLVMLGAATLVWADRGRAGGSRRGRTRAPRGGMVAAVGFEPTTFGL